MAVADFDGERSLAGTAVQAVGADFAGIERETGGSANGVEGEGEIGVERCGMGKSGEKGEKERKKEGGAEHCEGLEGGGGVTVGWGGGRLRGRGRVWATAMAIWHVWYGSG